MLQAHIAYNGRLLLQTASQYKIDVFLTMIAGAALILKGLKYQPASPFTQEHDDLSLM